MNRKTLERKLHRLTVKERRVRSRITRIKQRIAYLLAKSNSRN